ncbi:TetR/AcrR family transcriptional regulator [Allostreptomyces psammosilenae]|uniref:AcrR family transcriptional regulator n=1 Tax=Allostreptomyces psammosilenae TaxID=1892865 RepID=A0A852ZWU8_9ACTN|nr:TetR/AcrR family transcriptional regulator [Allostreptomyces psammosilenae]NYI06465.1 AcrR family transcriptional regulator [Allostreptomyces psammosilenae]
MSGTTWNQPAGPAEGLRERKKRQTRRHIADVAMGLFQRHGYSEVTMAEVARHADVSVNTVYNYFASKEDLFFDREEEVVDRLAAMVRERRVGESAARAVLRTLREQVAARDEALGLRSEFREFLRMLTENPTLSAKAHAIGVKACEKLRVELTEEMGAGPDDPTPGLVASQLGWVHQVISRTAAHLLMAGNDPDAVAERLLRSLDVIEGLLGERALEYAIRES